MAKTGFTLTQLKQAIRGSGLTITAAAVKIGCSRITLHNWLSKRSNVSPAYAERVSRFIAKMEAKSGVQ